MLRVCWEDRKTLLCELGKARSSHGALRVEDGSPVEEELTKSNGISLTLHSLHIVQHPLHYSCPREQRSHICGLIIVGVIMQWNHSNLDTNGREESV